MCTGFKTLENVLLQGYEEQEDCFEENIYDDNQGLEVEDSHEFKSQAPIADDISSGSNSGP